MRSECTRHRRHDKQRRYRQHNHTATMSAPSFEVGGAPTTPATAPPTSIPRTMLQGQGHPHSSATVSLLATSNLVAARLIRTIKSQAAWAKAHCAMDQAKRTAKWAAEAAERAAKSTATHVAQDTILKTQSSLLAQLHSNSLA